MIKNTTHSSIGCNGMANNDDYHGLEIQYNTIQYNTSWGTETPPGTSLQAYFVAHGRSNIVRNLCDIRASLPSYLEKQGGVVSQAQAIVGNKPHWLDLMPHQKGEQEHS